MVHRPGPLLARCGSRFTTRPRSVSIMFPKIIGLLLLLTRRRFFYGFNIVLRYVYDLPRPDKSGPAMAKLNWYCITTQKEDASFMEKIHQKWKKRWRQ